MLCLSGFHCLEKPVSICCTLYHLFSFFVVAFVDEFLHIQYKYHYNTTRCFKENHRKLGQNFPPGDRELVLLALDSDGLALEFASPELREDREVVLRAVKADGEALQFARVFQEMLV